jgi:hypothetical protein
VPYFVLTLTNFDSGRFERHDAVSLHSTEARAKAKAEDLNRTAFAYMYGDGPVQPLEWYGNTESDRNVACFVKSAKSGDHQLWTVERVDLED